MDLSHASMLVGAVLAVLHLPCLLDPAFGRRVLAGFPRNRWAAWALTAVDLVWAAWLLSRAPLGRFEIVKDYLVVLTPAAFFLVVFFMDELLAARALGGLLILVPAPLLDIARWHDSPLRLVVVVVAYIMAVEGVVLVLSPYAFRKAAERFAGNARGCRIVGALGALAGLLLILLGALVY